MSSDNGHPADDEKPQQHPEPHQCTWNPIHNEWQEVVGYVCQGCGAWKGA